MKAPTARGRLSPSNVPLQAAIAVFNKSPSPSTSKRFYEELLKATLVLLVYDAETEVLDDIVQSKAPAPKFRLLKGPQGRIALPAFTDPQSMLARYPEGGKMLFVPTEQIAKTLRGTTRTLVVNPARRQPSGIHVPRRALELLAKGEIPIPNAMS